MDENGWRARRVPHPPCPLPYLRKAEKTNGKNVPEAEIGINISRFRLKNGERKNRGFSGVFRVHTGNGNKSAIFSGYEVEKSEECVYIYRKCVNPY